MAVVEEVVPAAVMVVVVVAVEAEALCNSVARLRYNIVVRSPTSRNERRRSVRVSATRLQYIIIIYNIQMLYRYYCYIIIIRPKKIMLQR